jgi:hypothetical protein
MIGHARFSISTVQPIPFTTCCTCALTPFNSRSELRTHVKILPRNANERRSISHAIWPILESVQKDDDLTRHRPLAIELSSRVVDHLVEEVA